MKRRRHPNLWFGGMTLTVGLLLWVKLKLVSDFPRTAYAEDEPQQVEPPQEDAPDVERLQDTAP